jgi:hypothetical protein
MAVLRFFYFVTGACIILVVTFLGAAFYASLGHSSNVQLGSVSGLVTFHGRPQPNLCVDLVPAGGGRGSEGRTDKNGRYEAIYTTEKEGALVGQQQVIISVPEILDSHLNIITPRKPLLSTNVEVHAGTNQFDFDLAN